MDYSLTDALGTYVLLLLAVSQAGQKSPTAGLPASAAHPIRSTHPMQERAPHGRSARDACRQVARIALCVQLAHSRSTCCTGCRYALRMDPSAARSHHADKVRSGVPQRAPRAMCSARTPLSRAAVLVCCCHRLRPAASLAHLSAGAVRGMRALDVEGEGEWPPAVPGVSPPSRRSRSSHPSPF